MQPSRATIRACAVDRRHVAQLIETGGKLLAAGRIVEARQYIGEAHVELTGIVTAVAVAQDDMEALLRC